MTTHNDSRFRSAWLLLALAGGGLMTQVVPSYDEVAALRDQPLKSAASESPGKRSGGVTGIDVDLRKLYVVSSIA